VRRKQEAEAEAERTKIAAEQQRQREQVQQQQAKEQAILTAPAAAALSSLAPSSRRMSMADRRASLQGQSLAEMQRRIEEAARKKAAAAASASMAGSAAPAASTAVATPVPVNDAHASVRTQLPPTAADESLAASLSGPGSNRQSATAPILIEQLVSTPDFTMTLEKAQSRRSSMARRATRRRTVEKQVEAPAAAPALTPMPVPPTEQQQQLPQHQLRPHPPPDAPIPFVPAAVAPFIPVASDLSLPPSSPAAPAWLEAERALHAAQVAEADMRARRLEDALARQQAFIETLMAAQQAALTNQMQQQTMASFLPTHSQPLSTVSNGAVASSNDLSHSVRRAPHAPFPSGSHSEESKEQQPPHHVFSPASTSSSQRRDHRSRHRSNRRRSHDAGELSSVFSSELDADSLNVSDEGTLISSTAASSDLSSAASSAPLSTASSLTDLAAALSASQRRRGSAASGRAGRTMYASSKNSTIQPVSLHADWRRYDPVAAALLNKRARASDKEAAIKSGPESAFHALAADAMDASSPTADESAKLLSASIAARVMTAAAESAAAKRPRPASAAIKATMLRTASITQLHHCADDGTSAAAAASANQLLLGSPLLLSASTGASQRSTGRPQSAAAKGRFSDVSSSPLFAGSSPKPTVPLCPRAIAPASVLASEARLLASNNWMHPRERGTLHTQFELIGAVFEQRQREVFERHALLAQREEEDAAARAAAKEDQQHWRRRARRASRSHSRSRARHAQGRPRSAFPVQENDADAEEDRSVSSPLGKQHEQRQRRPVSATTSRPQRTQGGHTSRAKKYEAKLAAAQQQQGEPSHFHVPQQSVEANRAEDAAALAAAQAFGTAHAQQLSVSLERPPSSLLPAVHDDGAEASAQQAAARAYYAYLSSMVAAPAAAPSASVLTAPSFLQQPHVQQPLQQQPHMHALPFQQSLHPAQAPAPSHPPPHFFDFASRFVPPVGMQQLPTSLSSPAPYTRAHAPSFLHGV
jgi:hypothetical protein